MANGSSMYDAGNPKPVLCDNLEEWDAEGGGRGAQEGGGICIPNDDSGLPCWLRWKSVCLQFGRTGFDPSVSKILWKRKRQPTPVL